MRHILSAHPLNAKRKSDRIEVQSFYEKHGLRPCMVAPTKIIAGLGLFLDIAILDVPGATGDYRTLLTSKAWAIAKALAAPLEVPPNVFVPGVDDTLPGCPDGYDFGFLHIKAIDDAGHDKAVTLKALAFEAVDKMVGQLAWLLWEAECKAAGTYSLCVTGDHSTPVEYGDHSFEPVPFTICHLRDYVKTRGGAAVLSTSLEAFKLPSVEDSASFSQEFRADGPKFFDVSGDNVTSFSEIAAARGLLGRFPGSEMMGIIKKYMQVNKTSDNSKEADSNC